MSVIAFVPVRCGSKSIPFKNIKSFCGKPLVFWNVAALQHSAYIDRIVVATDCDDIADVVQSFGFDKVEVYWRLAENASDKASTESVMLEYLAQASHTPDDLFVLVQATSPLTETIHFDQAIRQYHTQQLDSLLSVVRIKRFFWHEDGTPQNYDFYNRPRRQDFDGNLMENGAFYIHTIKGILKHKCRLGDKVGVYEMPEHTAVELDEPHDWPVAEALMQKHILTPATRSTTIKLFLTDVDGVLTDGSMYYTENGDELKRFHTYDGMAFELLRKAHIKTGIITSETTKIVERRAEKLKVDYLQQGKKNGGKLAAAQQICAQEGITLQEVAYIGDDINCLALLSQVGVAACPANATETIKNLPNIIQIPVQGGSGAVRAFVEMLLKSHHIK